MRQRRLRGFCPLGERLDVRCLPSGYTPSQIVAAYGLGGFSFMSSSGPEVPANGAGQTIAIIDEYHDPNLQASLNVFDAQYDLPSIALDVVNQAGSQTNASWGEEETLDVEWAHAIAPGASIVVVEVSPGTNDQQQFNDVIAGLNTASTISGVSVVSMSWGYSEIPAETSYDSTFTTAGITYIAASGDSGTVQWPSSSPDVLAVGGTSLKLSSSGGYGSETGWSLAGGGLSADETEPSYQDAVQSTGDRSTPDVSFDANPNTGVSVYVIPPDGNAGQGQWEVLGGTSLAAPAWAGIIAIADQGRGAVGQSPLTGATQTVPALYAMPASAFNKVGLASGGTSSNSSINTAAYNTQAGLGSPAGVTLIDALVDFSTTTPTPTPTPTPAPTPTPTPTPIPSGPLPTPSPIIPTPSPTPTPTPTPVPVTGPSQPLPTPSPAPTPPPAPPPQAAPQPVAKHKHHVRSPKPTPRRPHAKSRARAIDRVGTGEAQARQAD